MSVSEVPSGPDLPRIPWEGGPEYWQQFPKTTAGGWTDAGFFPIVAWYDGISSDEEVEFDKKLGINTYIGMAAETPFDLFERNEVYWIGGRVNDSFDPASKYWVGDFLDDEVDGRFTPADGREHLADLKAQYSDTGRFKFANFTQTVIGDLTTSDAEAYINQYTDVVSIDMYWYTVPFCDLAPYRGAIYLVPITQRQCRTASSYGKTMRALRERDAADGKLQALWQFVENVNGGGGGGSFVANIAPSQVKGSVMSSIINEARGIIYFNQSLNGPCQGGNMFRLAQIITEYCARDQIDAVAEVNDEIHQLAPVLNTQSYQWKFGEGLDTMLKVSGSDAYIFAMVDGETEPGSRTFTIPPGIRGRDISVVFEGRAIEAAPDGTFSDLFAAEDTYHVYKVSLGGE